MSTIQINMHEAKSQLSKLAEKAWTGDTIVIAKSGKPYLELIPYRPNKPRVAGHYKKEIKLSEKFNETSTDIIEAFEGNS